MLQKPGLNRRPDEPTWLTCILYFHFRVPVCLFFRSSARTKRFIWRGPDFHEYEWTGDIPMVLHNDSFCHRGKCQLGIGLFDIQAGTGSLWSIMLSMQMNLGSRLRTGTTLELFKRKSTARYRRLQTSKPLEAEVENGLLFFLKTFLKCGTFV